MNQAQRNFLIKKIEEQTRIQVRALEESKPKSPDLAIWLLHYVLSDKFEIKSIEEIKAVIKKRALNKTEAEDWLGNSSRWGGSDRGIKFSIHELFVIPPEYEEKEKRYYEELKKINEQISNINAQSNNLIVRIQLASDKTLQTLISEVDVMGNLSLMDTTLKVLTGGKEPPQLTP